MSRFATHLVLAFGAVAMIAIVATLIVRSMFPTPPAPPEEKFVLPECELPPLQIGNRDQFITRLSNLAASGGLEAVKGFVEREIVPGRALLASVSSLEPLTEKRILDREVRHCDSEGVTPLNKPPLVTRASNVQRAGGRVQIHTWPRLEGPQPFAVTIWWLAPETP